MTDNKKDAPGKGPVWPSDRRPHATIDVAATEVGREDKDTSKAAGSSSSASALPPPRDDAATGATSGSGNPSFADRLAAARAWSGRTAGNNNFLGHLAAGVAGAVLTLIAAALFGLFSSDGGGNGQLSPDATKRLAALE